MKKYCKANKNETEIFFGLVFFTFNTGVTPYLLRSSKSTLVYSAVESVSAVS
jgi:hypothetical protein